VKDEHYETVGLALLWTLKTGLGSAFTPSVAAAWVQAYGLVASVMRAAAAQAAEPMSIRMPSSVHVPAPARLSQPPSSRSLEVPAMPRFAPATLADQRLAAEVGPLSQRMPRSRAPLSTRPSVAQPSL